jgi:hypothetical protein
MAQFDDNIARHRKYAETAGMGTLGLEDALLLTSSIQMPFRAIAMESLANGADFSVGWGASCHGFARSPPRCLC